MDLKFSLDLPGVWASVGRPFVLLSGVVIAVTVGVFGAYAWSMGA